MGQQSAALLGASGDHCYLLVQETGGGGGARPPVHRGTAGSLTPWGGSGKSGRI